MTSPDSHTLGLVSGFRFRHFVFGNPVFFTRGLALRPDVDFAADVPGRPGQETAHSLFVSLVRDSVVAGGGGALWDGNQCALAALAALDWLRHPSFYFGRP